MTGRRTAPAPRLPRRESASRRRPIGWRVSALIDGSELRWRHRPTRSITATPSVRDVDLRGDRPILGASSRGRRCRRVAPLPRIHQPALHVLLHVPQQRRVVERHAEDDAPRAHAVLGTRVEHRAGRGVAHRDQVPARPALGGGAARRPRGRRSARPASGAARGRGWRRRPRPPRSHGATRSRRAPRSARPQPAPRSA